MESTNTVSQVKSTVTELMYLITFHIYIYGIVRILLLGYIRDDMGNTNTKY